MIVLPNNRRAEPSVDLKVLWGHYADLRLKIVVLLNSNLGRTFG